MNFARSNNIKTANIGAVGINLKVDKSTFSQYLFSKL